MRMTIMGLVQSSGNPSPALGRRHRRWWCCHRFKGVQWTGSAESRGGCKAQSHCLNLASQGKTCNNNERRRRGNTGKSKREREGGTAVCIAQTVKEHQEARTRLITKWSGRVARSLALALLGRDQLLPPGLTLAISSRLSAIWAGRWGEPSRMVGDVQR